MLATVFHNRHDVRVEEVPAPQPVGPRDVLLRPFFCGICGTDLHEYAFGPIVIPTEPHALTGANAPQVLGHEFSAEVVDIGSEVTSTKVGDRVSVMPLVTCGQCYYCRRGLNHLCVVMACTGLSWDGGGIAELVVVQEQQVSVLPPEVDNVQGALIEPAAVAAYGVDQTGMGAGDTILITGAGPIGALSALYAQAGGASKVIVSEPNARRRALAEALGGVTVVDPTATDVPAFVRDLTNGVGVDVAAECSGSEPGLNAALASVRSAGTVTQVGLHVKPAAIDPMALSNRDLTLTGTWCYPVYDWPRIIALVASGRYPVERVLTEIIDVHDVVSRGFDRLLDPDGDAQKLLVRVGGDT
ncbi:2,3-butanediol dehydrogenase [Mycolicibacterium tokaiense]|uniref:Theronine dehydrogenase-like Zn-dependent dehydrogenase n=1 Tax=Mycolicibacterium tokaiense TaxID=39695 RepID=A0A378TD42_9MYCO|nr:2,3-butanediol dehydrogenase [Mycolicibacterium tokaiense]BBY86767.1 zinc-binding dehydrogenase [Mycolicibacterium tokaiense]STZ58728.1 theronine dehydrogenase-like Zn-dependent dehydrogenase [Mycolicibacterium tokaiense]